DAAIQTRSELMQFLRQDAAVEAPLAETIERLTQLGRKVAV
ncbi:MAG: hypothetical protein IRZ15_01840, partial [Bryobacteraceae bacterium]|nr:hypothetical protein [Bryobacteraceae bacterium]